MKHFTTVTVWIDDPETDTEREFEVGVVLDVDLKYEDAALIEIEEAEEIVFGEDGKSRKVDIEVSELPVGVRGKVETRVTEDELDFVREARDAADDADGEYRMELARDRYF